MDGRAGVQTSGTSGSQGVPEPGERLGTSASGNSPEITAFPLTIREVVRRGRRNLEELDRLRSEVGLLRARAESAEYLLRVTPDEIVPTEVVPPATEVVLPATNGHASSGHAANGHAANGHAANGHAANGHANNDHRGPGAAASGWATAAVLPRSRRA